jgi:hypothetical protein
LRAQKQEGVVTLGQALACGLTERQLRGLVNSGEYRRPHRGVFIDTAAPITPLQPVVAASFALGPWALASHLLAAWLWELIRTRAPAALEFSVAAGRSVRLPGVSIHRVTTMPIRSRRGLIPVTTPLRAVLDVGAVAPEYVTDMLINGITAKRFTPGAVRAEVDRAAVQGKPGVNAVRAALKELGVGRFTPSQLEVRARRLFRAAGLPDPHVEVVYGDDGEYRLDFYWPEADLVVEVDGWSIHVTPTARRRDYRKQNRVVMGDHWILRYDWFDIVHDVERTIAEIQEAYAARVCDQRQ